MPTFDFGATWHVHCPRFAGSQDSANRSTPSITPFDGQDALEPIRCMHCPRLADSRIASNTHPHACSDYPRMADGPCCTIV